MMKFVFIFLSCLFLFSGPAAAEDSLPFAAGIQVNKAQRLFQDGKIQNAVDLLQEFQDKGKNASPEVILEKGYNHYYIHFLLGNYYLFLAQDNGRSGTALTRKAAQCYQASVAGNPTFSPAWLNLARCGYELEEYERAGTAFEQGYQTAETPKPATLYYAAVCYFQANDSPKALKIFHRLIQAHPQDISLEWKEVLVNILFSLDRYKEALPTLEELARQTVPAKRKKWQEILLHQYLALGMTQKALGYATFLTESDILEPKWWKALCHIHLNTNQLKKGLTALMVYGYLTPLNREECLLAADLYLALDVPGQACKIYEQAPAEYQNPELFIKAGQASLMSHDPEKALGWIEKGLAAGPEPRLLQLKARIMYAREEYGQAADIYEAILRKETNQEKSCPNPGETWLMLGYSAMNCGQFQRAQTAFEHALKYKNFQKHAQENLTRIKSLETLLDKKRKTDADSPS